MTSLVLSCLLFVVIHSLVSGRPAVRGRLVAALGERAYMGLFSLLSLLLLIWMIRAYGGAGYVHLWYLGTGARHLVLLLMPLALFLVVCGLTVPNPTALGYGGRPGAGSARGILRVSRHPFLAGVSLWAILHLMVNGDLASLIFFGCFLLVALWGMPHIDARAQARHGKDWEAYRSVTSAMPLAAVMGGRNRLVRGEFGWWRPLLAVALYGALIWLHPRLFGVAVF